MFAAIKTSVCQHSRPVFCFYLHTDVTLLSVHQVAAPSVHPYQQKRGISTPP